jgi:probable addiction module antidote protein
MKRKNTEYADDLRERLKNPEYAAEYLNAVLNDDEEGADTAFLLALRNVAEAFQISNIAQKADLNRENLYRILSGRGNPKLSSLFAILRALGLKFSVQHTHTFVSVADETSRTYVESESPSNLATYSRSAMFRHWIEVNRNLARIEIRTKYKPAPERLTTESNPTFAYSA